MWQVRSETARGDMEELLKTVPGARRTELEEAFQQLEAPAGFDVGKRFLAAAVDRHRGDRVWAQCAAAVVEPSVTPRMAL